MRSTILALIFLPILETASLAEESRWTTLDTSMQVAVSAVTIVDWSQTLYIAHHPRRAAGQWYYEGGLAKEFIGPNPSVGRVNAYFAATLVMNAGIAYWLPKPYRTLWQSAHFIYEASTVNHNRTVGIGMSYSF